MSEVVMLHAVFRQSLVFRSRTSVIGVRPDADSSTWGEDAGDLDIFGVHKAYEVLHDDVHTILVEITMVAEREELEIQTLRLHHEHVRYVCDAYLGKVRFGYFDFGFRKVYKVYIIAKSRRICYNTR